MELTRDFGRKRGYRFKRNWLDNRWRASAEKGGAFSACHAEKQLAISVLRESIAHVLGKRDITPETMEKLKLAVEAKRLQSDFTIELEHKPCECCLRVSINFVHMHHQYVREANQSLVPQLDPQQVRSTLPVGAKGMVLRGKINPQNTQLCIFALTTSRASDRSSSPREALPPLRMTMQSRM